MSGRDRYYKDKSQPFKKQPTPPSNHPQPPPKKRNWWLIIGIIIFIIGVILMIIALVGFIDDLSAIKVSELEDDYDSESNTFKSYDIGDEIKIKGEITYEEDVSAFGLGHAYFFDNVSILFLSYDDIGDVGDEVVIRCEVKETTFGGKQEYLEVKSSIQEGTGLVCVLGSAIILIIGIVFLIIGFIKRKKKSDYVRDYESFFIEGKPPKMRISRFRRRY
jgi:hypothetical protein